MNVLPRIMKLLQTKRDPNNGHVEDKLDRIDHKVAELVELNGIVKYKGKDG